VNDVRMQLVKAASELVLGPTWSCMISPNIAEVPTSGEEWEIQFNSRWAIPTQLESVRLSMSLNKGRTKGDSGRLELQARSATGTG